MLDTDGSACLTHLQIGFLYALHVGGLSGISSKNQGNILHLHSGANAEQQKQEHLTKPHYRGALHSSINGGSIKEENTYAQPAGHSITRPYFLLPMAHKGPGFAVASGAESLTPPAPPSLYSSIDNIQCCSPIRDTDENSSQVGLVLTPNSAANIAFGRLSFNAAMSRCTETNDYLGNSLKNLKGPSGSNTSKPISSLAENKVGTGLRGGKK